MLQIGNIVYEKTVENTLCSVCDDSFDMATEEEVQHRLAQFNRLGREILLHSLESGQG